MAFVLHSQIEVNGINTFSCRPRTVQTRSRYREAQSKQTKINYGNIMFDRRVVRGSTYARKVKPTAEPDLTDLHRQQKIRGKAFARKRAREQLKPKTPEALQGRNHTNVQTELYLEELRDVTVASNADCQTDDFWDRPTSPLFIPAKSGKDAETQLEEGELFDYDSEVQLLLEVLVGKTIELSLEEVMKEEELASLMAQQRVFQELRNSEHAEMQRLQEQERRRNGEKERRVLQQQETLQREREIAEKIAARAYTQQYLADLFPAVCTSLKTHGFFYDPVEKDVESNFFPWLVEEVNNRLDEKYTRTSEVHTIIYDVIQKTKEAFKD